MRSLALLGAVAVAPLLTLTVASTATTATAITATGAAPPPTCFGKTATIFHSSPEEQTVRGTKYADVIVVVGPSRVIAGEGNDLVCGSKLVAAGPGDDRVAFHQRGVVSDFAEFYLGDGNDFLTMTVPRFTTISAGSGNDRVQTGRAGQYVLAGPGNDVVSTGRGPDEIHGDTGADRLYGQDGDDEIGGARGDDTLHGGDGADRLTEQPGEGRDVGRGGPGRDRCTAAIERQYSC